MRFGADGELVGALHQLIDLRAHRLLDDAQQLGCIDPGRAALGAADVEGAAAALGVGRSEERGVGKVWVSTCRSGWAPSHEKHTSLSYEQSRTGCGLAAGP